jgi:hypothetical protein
MRRLLVLVCAIVWVDTMLYAALTPLLPHFAHTLHLSKAGRSARRGRRSRRARGRAARRSSSGATRRPSRRPRRLDADGLREHRIRVRPRLLAARDRALPAGTGQRVHLGRRVRLAPGRGTARPAWPADRDGARRRRVRRVVRARARRGRCTSRPRRGSSARSPASPLCLRCGRCSSSRFRRTLRPWPRWDGRCSTRASAQGSG